MIIKFLIEDDYYIVIDEYSYNLARFMGTTEKKNKGKTNDVLDTIGYFSSIEKVLSAYLELRQKNELKRAGEGTLQDLADIITAENKRLAETLRAAFRQVTDWKGSAD